MRAFLASVVLSVTGPWLAPPMAAQGFAAPASPTVPVQAGTAAATASPLDRLVSLDLDGVTLKRALEEVDRQAELRLSYSARVVPLDRQVTIKVQRVTARAALAEILEGTGVEVTATPSGQVLLGKAPPAPAKRQPGSVSGRVTDAKSGNALAGAEVTLDAAQVRATGDDGRYYFAVVEPGSYTLMVKRIGYRPTSRPVTVGDGQAVTVDVALETAPTRLDEVVVTSTLVPTEVKALPTPVSVVTADQIEQHHIRRFDQLLRQLVPGLIAYEVGNVPNQTTISVRGQSNLLGNSGLKVYIDGVQASAAEMAPIDPASIERIEVIRGPQAAAIYGSDALGGVMEIFTKRGDPTLRRPQVSVDAAVGTIQSPYRDGAAIRQKYNASLQGSSGRVGFLLGGGYTDDGAWAPQLYTKQPSLFGGMRFEQGPLSVDLHARYYAQQFHSTLLPQMKATGYSSFQVPEPTRYHGRQETYGVKVQYRLLPGWEHQVVAGLDRSAYGFEQYEPGLRTPSDTFLTLLRSANYRRSVAYHTSFTTQLSPAFRLVATAGLDHNVEMYDYMYNYELQNLEGPISSGPNGSWIVDLERVTNTGYFAQAQLDFRDALFLTGSVRAERNSAFGDEIGTPVSPRVGLSYVHPLGGTTVKLRAAYGRALRPPSIVFKQGYSSPGYILEPNPRIRPERQEGPEVGVDVVFGGSGTVGVTYYNQVAKDLVGQSPVAGMPGHYVGTNVGRVRNEGLEFEGAFDLAGLQFTAQYAYTRSTLLEAGPDYTGYEQVGEQLSTTPKHSAGATATLAVTPRLGVTAGMAYVGPRETFEILDLYRCLGGSGSCGNYFATGNFREFWARYPGFAKANVSVDYTLSRGLQAYLSVENLTNAHPVEFSSSVPVPGRITTLGFRARY